MSDDLRAILFDFDGVLVNSEELHFRAFERAAKDAGITLGEEEYYRDLIGFDDRGVWKALAATRGLSLDGKTMLGLLTYKAQITRELIYEKSYTALPGAYELVRGLWRHYPIAVVTGARREEVETMLEGIRLRDCFRLIIAAEDVSQGKPDPEGYLKAVAEMSRTTGHPIEPAHALVFEDAPRVIERVKAVGFQTAGVSTHYGHDQLAAKFSPKSLRPEHVLAAVPGLRLFTD